MPARRPLPSGPSPLIHAALVPMALVAAPPVSVIDGDADDYEAGFFGSLIGDLRPDPMFAGAAQAGPLARDGADDWTDVSRSPAASRSE